MSIERVALYGATLFLLLGGCTSVGLFSSYREIAGDFAASHGFERRIYRAGSFAITAYGKKPAPSDELTVYIEGDGAPWRTVNLPPSDPTPHRLIVLELAIKDPRHAVIYLARPCQFLAQKELEQCSPEYWTDKRYSEEVVASIDNAIDQAKREYGASRLNLVGYSGGGTVARYLTQRRSDVAKLITIASPLDHKAWTEYHGLSPLTGAIELAEPWRMLKEIPQYHLVGEKDAIVPPSLLKSMLSPNAKILVIPGYDHECCWSREWGKRLAETGSLNTDK